MRLSHLPPRARRALAAFAASTVLLTACGTADDGRTTVTVQWTPAPDPVLARDAAVAAIYADAKRKDETALLALAGPAPAPAGSAAPQAPASSPPADPALGLALYTIDRDKYRDAFVAAYPQTHDGLQNDYGTRFVKAGVEPKGALFPILSLATIAAGGNPVALRKLVGAVALTDGGVGRAYAAQAARVLAAASPGIALDAIAALPLPQRLGAVAATDWCSRPPKSLLAFVPTPMPTPTVSGSPVATPSPAPAPSGAPAAFVLPTVGPVQALQQTIRNASSYPCTVAVAPHKRTKHANKKRASRGKHAAPPKAHAVS